jgi:mRNA-degrading endonuclease RelE of RelBE toxin-antitoxin system
MSYKIETIPNFDKELKRLAKKYNSVKTDIISLTEELLINPQTGTALGNNCYKIRMPITSKGKGKSGGARVITHIKIVDTVIYLLSVYDKSDKENISDNEIKQLLKDIDIE